MEIYLDLNVYLSIARRESGCDYVIAKLNDLKKKGVVFPHAPPHAEEVSARLSGRREVDETLKVCSLIQSFNGGFGYLPGFPNKTETEEIIRSMRGNPDLTDALRIHSDNLVRICAGQITEKDFETRVVKERFEDCLRRVDRYPKLTDVAKQNDIFHMGRRSQKSLSSNFGLINRPTEGLATFEETQKKHNLGPRRLTNISPDSIFADKHFMEFVRREFAKIGIDVDQVKTGSELMNSHYQKEFIIDQILSCMERAGFNQEGKNHEASITGRMHDVSHAIYATQAKYLVTNDERFYRKTTATYKRLNLATRVIKVEDFLRLQPFKGVLGDIILT